MSTLKSGLAGSATAILLVALIPMNTFGDIVVRNSEELVAAVRNEFAGSTITIAAGTYQLDVPLEPKAGMTLNGAGMDKTIITHNPDWKPSTEKLPDSEVNMKRIDTYAYLVRLQDKAADVTISNLTLRGPQLHGAIFGARNEDLHLHHLRIEDVLYCGVRTFFSRGAKIHDCEFIDAGGKWKRGGIPGTDGGINEPYDNLTVRNNHIISRTTATPRKDGLFGLNGKSDVSTIQIVDNIIECRGQPRPLLRNDASYGATIRNNRLTNVADTDRYENPQTDAKPGLAEPLAFRCGAHGELAVDGWTTRPTP